VFVNSGLAARFVSLCLEFVGVGRVVSDGEESVAGRVQLPRDESGASWLRQRCEADARHSDEPVRIRRVRHSGSARHRSIWHAAHGSEHPLVPGEAHPRDGGGRCSGVPLQRPWHTGDQPRSLQLESNGIGNFRKGFGVFLCFLDIFGAENAVF
jgi:hypothetical protein